MIYLSIILTSSGMAKLYHENVWKAYLKHGIQAATRGFEG